MNKFQIVIGFFCLILFASLVSCSNAVAFPEDEEEDAHFVNPKEWTTLLNDNDNLLVMFVSDRLTDCHSCVAAKEGLTELYKDFPERFLAKYVVFECKRAQKLCAKYGITQYPVIRLFSEGIGIYDFDYPSYEARFIAPWIRTFTAPKSTEISSEAELANAVSDHKCAIILFYQPEEDDKVLSSFKRTAAKFHEAQPRQHFYHFVLSADNVDALSKYDADPGDIILFKQVGGLQQYKFTEQISRKRLTRFIERNVPWQVYEIIDGNWEEPMKHKLPVLVAFVTYDDAELKQQVIGALDVAARSFKNAIVFAYKNAAEQGTTFFSKWHFDAIPKAAVMLYDNNNEAKYQFPPSLEITSDNVRDFCDDYVQGKLSNFVFKEKVPEQDENALITKLVVDNYRKIVHDPTKDVIVYFYLPDNSCPPCSAMTAPYEEFARKMKEESGRTDIVVARMDLQKNERTFGVRITTFPTILMFQKDDKFGEVQYPGARDANVIYKWARENATDWEAEEEEEEVTAVDGEVNE